MISNNEHDSLTLMQQQANHSVVDDLHRRGFIDQKARDSVLELLYPHVSWGTWTAQLFTILGWIFIVSGLVFYLSFNWENMSASYKLHTLIAGIICCAAGAWAFTLSTLQGQLFLTAACMLVGAFIAVFSQIYPTSIDNYQLLLIWAVLIVPWVLISRFAALWYIWLLILNVTIGSFWILASRNNLDALYFGLFILIVLDSGFLLLREIAEYQLSWCQQRWQRLLLGISLLALTLVPIITIILSWQWKNPYLLSSAILGLIVQCGLLYYYRLIRLDMWMLAATIISLCLASCTLGFKLLYGIITAQDLFWLSMSIIALIVFSLGATALRFMTPLYISNQDRMP